MCHQCFIGMKLISRIIRWNIKIKQNLKQFVPWSYRNFKITFTVNPFFNDNAFFSQKRPRWMKTNNYKFPGSFFLIKYPEIIKNLRLVLLMTKDQNEKSTPCSYMWQLCIKLCGTTQYCDVHVLYIEINMHTIIFCFFPILFHQRWTRTLMTYLLMKISYFVVRKFQWVKVFRVQAYLFFKNGELAS